MDIAKLDRNNIEIYGGIGSRIFDLRRFIIKDNDLIKVCKKFNLGSIISYNKEQNIKISHSGHIVFVRTSKGNYILKFSPKHTCRDIIKEFAINNFLIRHAFPTPLMYSAINNKPFIKIKNYFVTCYKKLNGKPLYLCRFDSKKIKKINEGIFRMNELLISFSEKQKILLDKETFVNKIIPLTKDIKACENFDHKNIIDESLKYIYKNYVTNFKAFIERPIHTNISLANMIYYDEKIFFLDLSHIRIDYELNDLANLVVYCYLLNIDREQIGRLINGYFRINKIADRNSKILNTFIIFHLIRNYIKAIKNEKKIEPYNLNHMFLRIFNSEIQKEKNKTMKLIKKFNAELM